MSQQLILKIAGLYSNPNEFSSAPEGSLAVASNILISKDNVAESRRGNQTAFSIPALSGNPQYADAFSEYQNDLLVHYGSVLAYWDGTNLNPFSGSYNHPSSVSTMKFASENRNLYFNTANGVYRLDSLSDTPVLAGMPAALDTEVSLNTTAGSGFLLNNSSTAYRILWGTTDANQNLILGSPSQQTVINNGLSGTAQVDTISVLTATTAQAQVNTFTVTSVLNTTLYSFTVNGKVINFTSSGSATAANILTGLLAAYNTAYSGTQPATGAVSGTTLTFTATTAGTAVSYTYISTLLTNLTTTANIPVTAPVTQVDTFAVNTVTAAHTYNLTVNGTTFTYLALSGDVQQNILTGLLNAYNNQFPASVGPPVSPPATGVVAGTGGSALLTMTSTTPGLAVYYTGVDSSLTRVKVTANVPGHIYTFLVNGQLISFTAVDSVQQNVLVGLLNAYTAAFTGTPPATGVVTGTGSGALLTLTASVAGTSVLYFANDALTIHTTTTANTVGPSANVNVTFTVPQGITVNNFYQVYRGDQIPYFNTVPPTAATPDDNMQLVYEGNPTSAQISALSVTVADIVPDTLRGAALYTNASQQGILQENTVPPFCVDMCSFKNCMFYLNTSNVQNLQLEMLSVGGTNGVQLGDTITIGGNIFTAISGTPTAGSNNYQLITAQSPAQNVNLSATNLVTAINQSSTNTNIYAFYVSADTDLPGKILIQNRNLGSSYFTVTVSGHGSAYNPVLPTSGATVFSTNTSNLNGLMYSKQQQPDAVPALNIFYPGSGSQPGYRILASRDSMFILKQDGVFLLTGTSPQNFSIITLDNTVFLNAPNSAVSLNNSVYALSSQGVVEITDSGAAVISIPIEDQLNQIVGQVGATNIAKYGFGVAYESERQYMLFLPQSASDTSATIVFVYNYITKKWTTWDRQQLAGYVTEFSNLLFLGNVINPTVSQERKNYEYTDYVDESVPITIVSFTGNTLTLADTSSVSIGDIIYQSQSVNSEVTSILGNNTITVADTLNTWTDGAATCLTAIVCEVQWLPVAGQNPGMLKQFSEGTLIFRDASFTNATLSFQSDLVPSPVAIPLTGTSPLGWGLFPWGETAWGGIVVAATDRTYVPRNQQKCTLLTPNFTCQSGYSNFLLEGISLQYRTISSRTSR